MSGYAPGVYLGISNEDYHNDPAVSSSGIKDVLKSPEKYWYNSPLNPNRKPVTKEAFKLGQAYHELVLEPDSFSFDVKAGVKTSTVENTIGEGQYNEMVEMRETLKSNYPLLWAAITGGYSEVSVFWVDEETGVNCRCRFDHWKPAFITDLKTCSDIDKTGLRDIFYDFGRYGYDVSGAMYMEGSRNLKKMLRAGNCHIDERISEDFIAKYLASETERFMFLYQCKEAPYEAQGRCMDKTLADCGMDKLRSGLATYRRYMDKFGNAKWKSDAPEIVDITIDDVSQAINLI